MRDDTVTVEVDRDAIDDILADLEDADPLPVGAAFEATHEPTDRPTIYNRSCKIVRVTGFDDGYYDLEMVDADGVVRATRNIAAYRAEKNVLQNDGKFGLLVPDDQDNE